MPFSTIEQPISKIKNRT